MYGTQKEYGSDVYIAPEWVKTFYNIPRAVKEISPNIMDLI